MHFSFKAFSFTLPIPGHGQGLKEITVDCLTSRRANPFDKDVVIWTEMDAVWCNGVDIFPLLKSELISYEDCTKGTLEGIALEYGQRVWSGHAIPGITQHPVYAESKVQHNAVTEPPDGVEQVRITYERVIHGVYVDREDKAIDIKRWYFYQEPGSISINNTPAAAYSERAYRDIYARIIAHNDHILDKLYFCLDTDTEVMSEAIEMLQAT